MPFGASSAVALPMIPYVLGKLGYIPLHWCEQYYGRLAAYFGASERYGVLNHIAGEF